jgi:hypothetical protein
MTTQGLPQKDIRGGVASAWEAITEIEHFLRLETVNLSFALIAVVADGRLHESNTVPLTGRDHYR